MTRIDKSMKTGWWGLQNFKKSIEAKKYNQKLSGIPTWEEQVKHDSYANTSTTLINQHSNSNSIRSRNPGYTIIPKNTG